MAEKRVLDAGFVLAKEIAPLIGHWKAKDRLHEMFPAFTSDEIQDLYLRATTLVDACYEVGDKCRRESIPDAEAVSALRERFPGSSEKTYEQALTWGWFISR